MNKDKRMKKQQPQRKNAKIKIQTRFLLLVNVTKIQIESCFA